MIHFSRSPILYIKNTNLVKRYTNTEYHLVLHVISSNENLNLLNKSVNRNFRISTFCFAALRIHPSTIFFEYVWYNYIHNTKMTSMQALISFPTSKIIFHPLFNHFPPELRIATRKNKDGNKIFDAVSSKDLICHAIKW